ncbi:uncharacterized protein LOC117649643 [Thrips palmi]|uniref:Uncharacterized protein LOC117649643 n=1 Tax=Thrips palmi TaxID=161013 RepID=A0A6P8ZTN3_THRPL|nr:uncharacterized protein LOC117649643 [Thrips palmi]
MSGRVTRSQQRLDDSSCSTSNANPRKRARTAAAKAPANKKATNAELTERAERAEAAETALIAVAEEAAERAALQEAARRNVEIAAASEVAALLAAAEETNTLYAELSAELSDAKFQAEVSAELATKQAAELALLMDQLASARKALFAPRMSESLDKGVQTQIEGISVQTQTTLSSPAELQAVETVAVHGETQEQLEAAMESLRDRPALHKFVEDALKNPVAKEFLMGRIGLGDVFMQPNLVFERITPALRREVSKPLTWPRLFSKGKRALQPAALSKLLGLMDTDNGRKVFAVLFTFLGGVVLRPHPEHIDIPEPAQNALKRTLQLPAEYKGAIHELEKGSKSFSCRGQVRVKYSSISQEMRETVALEIKSNRFVIQEEQLVELDKFLTQNERTTMRVILLCFGGVVLDSNFVPMGLSSIFNAPRL